MIEQNNKPTTTEREELLVEIRDRYRYALNKWEPIFKEGRTDIRYLTNDPWDDKDRKAREEAGRPCISHDELTQYYNQCVNSMRQNKRGIKIDPAGTGGNVNSEKMAEYWENRIRAIERKSNAAAAYTCGYENAVGRSYGFWRVSRKYTSDRSFAQELVIRAVQNPESIVYDPDCKEPDWSDPRYVFALEPMDRKEFKRQFPNAEVKDFTSENVKVATDWISDKQVLVGEYWKSIPAKRHLLQFNYEDQVVNVFDDELTEFEKRYPGISDLTPVKELDKQTHKIKQYWTNGVEILSVNDEPGQYIPIIPCLGRAMYVHEGGTNVLKLMSLIRLARDPQMSLAYVVSLQAEAAGLLPKTPWLGYVGQFETDAEKWESSTKLPTAFLQVDPVVDGATNQVLPLPQRQQLVPAFMEFTAGIETCRRAIQASMGIMPLPTDAQQPNNKSGKALRQIQSQQQVGSYHFPDNFERALQFTGRVLMDLGGSVEVEEAEVPLHKADDSRQIVKINTEQPYADAKTKEQMHFPVADDDGEYDVSVSAGPSYQSQREEASEFLDTLISNLKALPVATPQAQKLLSLAIQMKQLGPKGDQMAEIISPNDTDEMPPQAQQAISQVQEQLKALDAYCKQLEEEKKQLEFEQKAKVLDNQQKLDIRKLELEADVAKAEINTKAQDESERKTFVNDIVSKLMDHFNKSQLMTSQQQHEAEMTAAGQAHESSMADAAAQNQAAMQQQAAEQQPQV